jgi:hypothetical protein
MPVQGSLKNVSYCQHIELLCRNLPPVIGWRKAPPVPNLQYAVRDTSKFRKYMGAAELLPSFVLIN